MSLILSLIGEIVSSVSDIDTVVTSFKKGYVDDTESVSAIIEDYSKLQLLLDTLKENKNLKNTSNVEFWEEFCRGIDSANYSLMEGILSILYFVLITKEKYSGVIPVLCADVYLNILLIPGAYGHGILRCSLYQVTVSAILRSINNEELIQQTESYRVKPANLVTLLISTFGILDEMTVKFVWSEFCVLLYECCLSPLMSSVIQSLFQNLLHFALLNETDVKMGELLRVLLPIISLYQEGRKMDEKPIRNAQKVLLSCYITSRDSRFDNCTYALIQRLMINSPDRVDDRRNTLNCLMQLLLSLNEKEKKRVNTWITLCSRCGIANIRLCCVSLARSLLTSCYIADTFQQPSQNEIENANGEESGEHLENEMEEEPTIQRELFVDEKPLHSIFFDIILSRCNDIVISIRTEAIHSIGLLLDYLNENPSSPLQAILDPTTSKRIVTIVNERLTDSAVGVRKNALNAYAGCAMNSTLRPSMDEKDIVSVISNLLQDSSVMVKRSALQLYYRLLETTPSLRPLFFSISLSMFENTSNADMIIIRNMESSVFANIIDWAGNRTNLTGWEYFEYFNTANVSVLETVMKIMIDKNLFSLNRLMKACEEAIDYVETGVIEMHGLETIPRMEENAWMLLLLTAKFYDRMDIEFIERNIHQLIEHANISQNVSRDKFIILTTMTVVKKFSRDSVQSLYVALVKQLLKLQIPLDLIHSFLRLYLAFLDCLYSDNHTIQKAVNAFVAKMEVKVDKILREFIFRSGAKLRSEPLHESQTMTQRLPEEEQHLSQSDGLKEVLEGDNSDLPDIHGECSLLADEVNLRWLYPWIFVVGELSLLGSEESEEGNLSRIHVRLQDKTVALLQSLTTYSLPTINPQQESIVIPSSIRAHAMISFGKLCITSATLAKRHLPMFIRELEISKDSVIRNNIIIIIGDICTKHTSLVERYIPVIANCIVDTDDIVRIHSLSIISKLVLEDYVKLKPVLLCSLLCALVDPDENIAAFAYQLITKQVFRKFPKIFVAYFVEIMSILNGYLDNSMMKKEYGAAAVDINLGGGEKRKVNARRRIYRLILEQLDDEAKLQVSCKLCQNVLGPLVDNDELANLTNDLESPGLNLVKDAFAVLCSKELKVGNRTRGEDEDLPAEILESKKTVLSKLEKRTMLEQVLPLLISLKIQLEQKRSVLLRDLMMYLKVITVNYKSEMEQVFSDNPRLQREIEYDLRQFDGVNQHDPSARGDVLYAINSLATPLIQHTYRNQGSTPTLTPRLKVNARESLIEEKNESPKKSSLQVHLSLDEKDSWDIDAKRLSFSTPVKPKGKKEAEQKSPGPKSRSKKIKEDDDFDEEEEAVMKKVTRRTSKKRTRK